MSTWILTEKLSKITAQARKINQEIAKEINDFVLVLMYSSTLTLEAMIGWLSVGWKDDQFTKTLAKILQRLKTDS
jgi:23S rRNA maturation mini-RNase III